MFFGHSVGEIYRERRKHPRGRTRVLFDHGAWPAELITVNWQLPHRASL